MILTTGKEVVLGIPDLQTPFEHKHSFDFLDAVKKKYRPTKIVNIGDSMDAHALSRWVTDPDGMGPADEYKAAIEKLKVMYAIFPEGVEVISNHNERLAKRAYGAGIPSLFLKRYEEIMQYPPGWSIAPHVKIDSVIYEHGHTQGGQYAARNLAYHNGQSTVIGHHHSYAGIQYIATRSKMWWGMNIGCLIDLGAYAFKYAAEQKFKPTLGCGIIDRGVPMFIPMRLNRKLEWLGVL